MKRSNAIKLLLMGLAPITIVGCSDEGKTDVKTVKTSDRFAKLQDCVAAGKPQDVCAETYMAALKKHKDLAPKYEKEADCEADFMPGYCVATEDGKFMPKMAGFSLATETRQIVDRTTGAPVVTQNTDSNGFITGMLLGNLMSGNGGTSYRADPYYSRRDPQGVESSNTLNGFASGGYTPSRSIQERARTYSNVNSSTIKSSRSRYDDDDDDTRTTASSSGSYYGGSTSSGGYSATNTKPASSTYGTQTRTPATSTSSTYGSQTRSSGSYNSGSNSGSSYSKPSSISVSSAISRGGFGATSSAKSSFGSSFGGSFGG
jgi:uncharacterized protein YgiB involved in biofilm formation